MPRRPHAPPEWRRIRQLFLERRASYDSAEVSTLLGVEPATVRQAVDGGAIAAVRSGEALRIAWEDVVALGLEHRWTYRMLAAALRGFDDAPLPPLVRTVAGRVVLPRYQWQILRVLATRKAHDERRQIIVSDLVEEAVSSAFLTTIEEWEGLATSLPGVRAAAAWPWPE
jgi:hypothetical protein